MNGSEKPGRSNAQTVFKKQKEFTAGFNALLVSELESIGIKTVAQDGNGLEHSFRVLGISREQEKAMSVRKAELDDFIKKAKENGVYFSSDKQAEAEYLEEVRRTTKEDKEEHNAEKIHDIIKETTSKVINIDEIKKAQEQEEIKRSEIDLKSTVSGKLELQGFLKETELRTSLINELKFSKHYTSLDELDKDVKKQIAKLETDFGLVKLSNGNYSTENIIIDEFDTQKNIRELVKVSNPKTKEQANQEAEIFSLRLKAKGFELNEGQLEACKLVAREQRITYVVGDAGTGKTSTVVKFANQHYERKGRKVIGLATQTLTATNLKDADVTLKHSFAEFFAQAYKEGKLQDKAIANFKKSVFIVDEASMVSAEDYRKLTEFSLKTDSTILFVGDHKQLQSVKAGNAIKILDQELNGQFKARLDENTRQKNPRAKFIAEAFRDQKVDEAVEKLKEYGWLSVSNDNQTEKDLIDKLARDYVLDKSATKLSIAATNDQCDRLNDRIRTELVKNGFLKKEDLDKQVSIEITRDRDNTKRYKETKARFFAVGDKIVFNQNIKIDKIRKLKNGQNALIKKIENRKNGTFLTIDIDGQQLRFNASKDNTFTHAYAITAHKSQGQTVENAYVLGDENTNSNSEYVKFSRHKEQVKLYIESQKLDGFIKTAKVSQQKSTTLNDDTAKKIYGRVEMERYTKLKLQQERQNAENFKAKQEEDKRLREKAEREAKAAEEYNKLKAQMAPKKHLTPRPGLRI